MRRFEYIAVLSSLPEQQNLWPVMQSFLYANAYMFDCPVADWNVSASGLTVHCMYSLLIPTIVFMNHKLVCFVFLMVVHDALETIDNSLSSEVVSP